MLKCTHGFAVAGDCGGDGGKQFLVDLGDAFWRDAEAFLVSVADVEDAGGGN